MIFRNTVGLLAVIAPERLRFAALNPTVILKVPYSRMTKEQSFKVAVTVGIQLVIASIHVFRIGTYLPGALYHLYYSYFSDFIIPFGAYFLISINDFQLPFLRSWKIKALIAFTAPTAAEICQYFGLYVLGVTFDTIDIVMYGLGVMLAVIVDTRIFPRVFGFWTIESGNGLS